MKTGQTADVLKKEPTGIPDRCRGEGQGKNKKGESGVSKERVLLTETEGFPSRDQEERMRSVRMGSPGRKRHSSDLEVQEHNCPENRGPAAQERAPAQEPRTPEPARQTQIS